MNDNLFRPQFDRMDLAGKTDLMESLAARHGMGFLGLSTFERWGRACTTGVFGKDGREFVFVPGDTVTLGWDGFAVGLSTEDREDLESELEDWGIACGPEDLIREGMSPVRKADIGPMLVSRKLEELCWERVGLKDPRLRPEWLVAFRDFAWSESSSLTLVGCARIERTGDGFRTWVYNEMDYGTLVSRLGEQGLSLPTADEWAYLCGGGCRTLFPWGDGFEQPMDLRWFRDPGSGVTGPDDLEKPNFFGLSIGYDPYKREVVMADRFTTCGGDGGCALCGGAGPFLGYLPCSPHRRPYVHGEDALDGDFDFCRPVIRVGGDV